MTTANQLPIQDFEKKLETAKSILILVPMMQTVDNVSAALSLYLSLKNHFSSKENKASLTIASATAATVAYQRLYGVGDMTQNLGSKNLVITLKTTPSNIEKVSVDEGPTDFSIIVETKAGSTKIATEDVSYSYRGLDADLLITVGLATADAAGNLYTQNPNLFADRETVVICGNNRATAFGNINMLDPQASGSAELVAKIIQSMSLPCDGDIATNLLAGIESVTNNFAIKAGADTFEVVAWLLKNGGRRNHLNMPLNQQPGFASPFGPSGNLSQTPAPTFSPSQNMMGVSNPSQNFGSPNFAQGGFNPPSFGQPSAVNQPGSFMQPQNEAPIEPAPNQIPLTDSVNGDQNNNLQTNLNNPPNDWLQPKIYRGNQS